MEHRAIQGQRVRDSSSLTTRFQQLKSLNVDLSFYDAAGVTKNSHIKYAVNLDGAKSVFRFSCPNNECVRGDFDLTDVLAKAVDKRLTSVTGEMQCPGWQSTTTIDSVHCNNILRYKLTLSHKAAAARSVANSR